jgi:uncharacterized protein YukE
MTRIRMVTEDVRQVAYGLGLSEAELEGLPSDLKKLYGEISSAWQGGNGDYYAREISSLADGLRGEVENLRHLSSRLNNEVTEWQNADAAFGKVVSAVIVGSSGGTPWWGISEDIRTKVGALGTIGKGLATLGVISGMSAGTTYAGQVIFRGGQGLKSAAGLSSHLTHIKAANIPRHLLNQSNKISGLKIGMAVWEFANKGAADWAKYEKGSEKAVALGIDGLFVAGKTFITHHIAHIATTAAVGALVTAGAPAVGVAAVGVAVWWGSSVATDFVADKVVEWAETSGVKDSIVEAGASQIDAIGQGIRNTAHNVDKAFSSVIQRTVGL